MKYSFAAALFAVAVSAQSTTMETSAASTITAAPTGGAAAAPSAPAYSTNTCLAACKEGDRECAAHCVAVPVPNSSMVVALDQCVSKSCVPFQTVTGDPYYTDYAKCMKSCEGQYYYNPTNTGGIPGVAQPTGGSDSGAKATGTGADSGSGSAATGTDASGNATGTETGTGAAASKTGSGNKFTFSVAGLIGAIGVVVLAL